VSQNVGPVEAVKNSATLLKKTWGENVIGNVGMGLVFFIYYCGVIGLGIALVVGASQTGSPALIVLVVAAVVIALVALALVHSALQGVYSAALYRYATAGNVGEAFSGTLLSNAFKPKS
jgi:hypothetical protein